MARCAALLALAGGAVAYTTHPTTARISAFVDTMDKAPKLPKMEEMKETECPRCGTAKGGAVNCCSGDGAWAGKCSMVSGEMEHTWTEGFAACIGAATQQQQAVLNASDFGAAETPGGIHEYPGELSKPLQKASEAIAAGFSGSYDSAVAGTMPEVDCNDENSEQCPLWAQKGECEANEVYMRASCKLSCGQCYSKKAEDSKTSALRRKETAEPSPSPSPSPAPAKAVAKAVAVSSPSPLAKTEAAQAKVAEATKAKVAEADPAKAEDASKAKVAAADAKVAAADAKVAAADAKVAATDAERSAEPMVVPYNKTAPENNASPEKVKEDPAHGDVKHGNEYALAERMKLVREQAVRDAAATAEKVKAESLMSKDQKDALDRSEYQAAIATALASAKVATRDPGDRMEVWEEAIKKAVEKKETGLTEKAKVDTLVPGQLRSPTKEEATQASATKQQASPSTTDAAAQAVGAKQAGTTEGVAEVRPFESKTAQFTAFARSSAETRPGEKDDLAPAADAPKEAAWMPPGTPVLPAVTPTEAQTAPAEAIAKVAPAETKASPFAAFATAHAAARELCKGKQGEC